MANSENPIRKVFSLTLARLHEQTHIKMISTAPTILSQAIFPVLLVTLLCTNSLCQNNILTIPGRSHSFFLPHTLNVAAQAILKFLSFLTTC